MRVRLEYGKTGLDVSAVRLWELPATTLCDELHLKLSVQARTARYVDERGNLQRLTQYEWLDKKKRLVDASE